MIHTDDIAVRVENASKDFRLPHERISTVKGVFTKKLFRKKNNSYSVQHALHDISFEVKKGEFFGIVGRNGSGKSTLLKMLAGIYQPNAGSVGVEGKLVPFIELGVGFNPELTGRENVYLNGALLGFTEKEIDEQYDSIVAFAELEDFMDQKLKNYSSGMQVRLAFSVATTAKADVLLIDEVLAVGDADFQRKCFDYFQKLKGGDTTVIFVTHDMNAVREYCDRAILIEKSKLIAEGSADTVAAKYTKLFIDSAKTTTEQKSEKRWGDGVITYTNIDVPKLLKAGEDLVFSVTATAKETVKNPNLGFLIRNASHTHILGTNTMLQHKKLKDMKAGESVTITWKIPNIFNDGIHYIDPAAVHKGNHAVGDWWEEAASFQSLKDDRTPYLVNPDIICSVNESN